MKINYSLIYDLACMSANVYHSLQSKSWRNVSLQNVLDISVQNDSVKMYFFYGGDSDYNVVAIKGTTMWGMMANVEEVEDKDNDDLEDLSSAYNDKYNDNLYFSCCYYKQSSLFDNCDTCEKNDNITNVCTNKCCSDCYKNTLNLERNYFNIAKEAIEKIRESGLLNMQNLIFTGHSLGGIVASMLSIHYNATAITFETPGDKHYIQNVFGISDAIGDRIFHFGHDADPIFTGTCGSLCTSFGYNIDTKCHFGNTCLYNAKEKLGYSSSIFHHSIDKIIKYIIPKWEENEEFPNCIQDTSCTDCSNWELV